jgi:hypothetical protein
MIKESDTQILTRILQLDGDRLSPEKAQMVLSLDFPPADFARMQEFGEKATEGRLTPEEREQYETYVRMADVLAILKSRARLLLKKLGQTA